MERQGLGFEGRRGSRLMGGGEVEIDDRRFWVEMELMMYGYGSMSLVCGSWFEAVFQTG